MKSTVKLMNGEEVLKILSEQAPVGACIIQDGNFCYINSFFSRATGYTADELIGKDSLEIVVPEDREMVRGNTTKMLKGELLSPYQFRVTCKDGSIIWVMAVVKSVQYHGRRATLGNYMEITERKQIEDAVRQSEENYRFLSEQAPVGVCIMQDGKFCYVNSKFPIAIGYTVDELVGKDSLEIVVPEDREMVMENTIRMLKGELLSPYQFRVTCKDGSIIWVMATVKPIQYHGKRATLGNYMEITGRKQIEEKLKESEQKYRTILEEMGDGYFETDLAGHITFVNDAMIRILGYSKEEIIGMNYRALRPEKEAKAVFEAYNRMYKTGEPLRNLFTEIICKDGKHIFAETSAFPIRNDKGEIVGFRGIRCDITERKRMEEALRQSEENYKSLFNSSVVGMYVMDVETLEVVTGNRAAAEMAGFSSPGEGIGINPLDFVVPEDRTQVLEVAAKEFEQDLRRTHEVRVIGKDGKTGWITISSARIIYEGRPAALVSISNITERKQAEEALKQSEEKYRTILEEMEDSYFEVDLGGHLTFVNNSVCRDLGYSMEELIGISYKDFTAEEDIESLFRAFNEVYQTGVPNKGFPWKTTRKDGSHGFAETSISLLRNSNGEIIGFRGVGRDVTERKQTEEKLRQSEENYKTLFNSSVVGMYVLDIETMKIVMGNRAAREMAGFSSTEEGIGINPFDFVVPQDREKVIEIAVNEFLQDSRRTHEVQVVDKNGRGGWQSFSIARITHQGRLASLVSVMDITERKKMEEALRQSEENYRALFDSSVIGTFVLDAETMKIVMGNEAAMKLAGLDSPREDIGIDPFGFVLPEDREEILEIVTKELFEQDLRRTHEFRAITKDGRKIWISITGARIMQGGKLAGLVSFTDITERKRMEEALRQSEENYRALFDSSVIGTIVLDAETRKAMMANQAAAKIFELSSAKEGIGLDVLDFVPPEDRERVLEVIRKDLFEQDLRRTAEFRAVTKSGRELWISVTAARIMHDGKLAGLIAFTDITDQKKQNERLMMTDRLASLGELASGTAHELNNPLTSIIGFSQLLMEKEVPDDIREDLKIMNSEAQRAVSVTQNLLTFARKHASVKQRNQINSIIEDVLKLRAYEHKANSMEVERHLAPDLPEIMIDYFQMQQVFMNIVINAEYFMIRAHGKGTLTITTEKQNDTVMISIADDGPGIPPENLKRIFDPFFTTKEAGKGTGLGLSICHGIVTEHGGQIHVKSKLGKGATFFIALPIKGHSHIEDMFKTD
jgi:two-component system NtrC family sensor kinase